MLEKRKALEIMEALRGRIPALSNQATNNSPAFMKWHFEKKPGLLDELAAERKALLQRETGELQQQADKLAEEIRELGGETASRIV